MEFFKTIDILRKDFAFYIDKRRFFKTFLGGVLSVFIYIGTLVCTYYFGQDLFFRENPQFLQKSEMSQNFPKKTINNTNFFYAMAIMDSNNSVINHHRFFDFKLAYRVWAYNEDSQGFSNTVKMIYDLEVCNSTIHHVNEDNYNKFHLKNYYCAMLDFEIGGDWSESEMKYVNFLLQRCSRSTEIKYNITCASDDELENYPGGLYYSEYLGISLVDPKLYDKPVSELLYYEYNFLNFRNNRTDVVFKYFFESVISSDTGLFFKDVKNVTFLQYEQSKYNQYYGNFQDARYVTRILLSRLVNLYDRIYLKLPELLASIGGFMGIFISILERLYKFHLHNELKILFYDKLFRMEIDYEELDDPDKDNKIYMKENELLEIELRKMNQELHFKGVQYILDDKKDNNLELDSSTRKMAIVDELNNVKDKKIKEDTSVLNSPVSKKKSSLIVLNNAEDISMAKKSKIKKSTSILKRDKKEEFEKDIVLNKEVLKIIDFKKHQRKRIIINSVDRCILLTCPLGKPTTKNFINEKILKYELIKAVDEKLLEKVDIISLFKNLDQVQLLKKLVLNESQCYLLKRIGNLVVANKPKISNIDIKDINSEKEREKENLLLKYIKDRKEKGILSYIDILLIRHADYDIANKVGKVIDLD